MTSPSSTEDTLYGGVINDINFGAHVSYNGLDGMETLAAAVRDAGGDASSNASIHPCLFVHRDLISTLLNPSSPGDQNDILMGGTGHDILAGQGGNDLLIGNGYNSVTRRYSGSSPRSVGHA